MEWLNIYGLVFIAVIMIPNIMFALKCKDGFANRYKNRAIEIVEQAGRIGCLAFMMFNIPGMCRGWWFNKAFVVYIAGDTLLIAAYCIVWMICWKKNSRFRALALSIIPSLVFLFSGVMCRSVLLVLSAVLFTPAHILISYKNADYSAGKEEKS